MFANWSHSILFRIKLNHFQGNSIKKFKSICFLMSFKIGNKTINHLATIIRFASIIAKNASIFQNTENETNKLHIMHGKSTSEKMHLEVIFLSNKIESILFCHKKFFISIETYSSSRLSKLVLKASPTRTSLQYKWILHWCVWIILCINLQSFMQCNWQIDIHWIIYWFFFGRELTPNGCFHSWIISHVFLIWNMRS